MCLGRSCGRPANMNSICASSHCPTVMASVASKQSKGELRTRLALLLATSSRRPAHASNDGQNRVQLLKSLLQLSSLFLRSSRRLGSPSTRAPCSASKLARKRDYVQQAFGLLHRDGDRLCYIATALIRESRLQQCLALQPTSCRCCAPASSFVRWVLCRHGKLTTTTRRRKPISVLRLAYREAGTPKNLGWVSSPPSRRLLLIPPPRHYLYRYFRCSLYRSTSSRAQAVVDQGSAPRWSEVSFGIETGR